MRARFPVLLIAAVGAATLPVPTLAQTTIDGRVTRLEKEMRAVQRKVFPGGAGMTLEPEITPPQAPATAAGTPATSPVADLTARVTAIETQLRSLTAQVEQGNFKIRALETSVAALQARLAPPPAVAEAPAPAATPAVPVTAAPTRPASTPSPAPSATPAPARPASGPSLSKEARMALVAAVERPSTGDAAADAYTYGFRLWSAKFFPEAQVQLKDTVDTHGNSSVASRAHNLLGRAYLDDGKPALASVAFYENYQKRPKGDRAADSLTYLGEALIQLKKPADACKVYLELEEVYGAALRQELRDMMTKGRVRAKCGA